MTDTIWFNPNIPALLTEIVPPTNSDGWSLFSLAFLASYLASLAIWISPLVYDLKMIGVINPLSVETAIDTSEYLNCLIEFYPHWTLTAG